MWELVFSYNVAHVVDDDDDDNVGVAGRGAATQHERRCHDEREGLGDTRPEEGRLWLLHLHGCQCRGSHHIQRSSSGC